MAKRRYRMSRRSSKRNFRRGAVSVNRRNSVYAMRGGYRI